ncbi:hypothetical protein Ciccas_004201 [Cichlidogyrus casuarinus]|uniref:Uncharacterized protein n=1 Tax=Cichlidogyrus casuarinus TaxID=1844966 RepID=A0ABD2QC85_9PLAT
MVHLKDTLKQLLARRSRKETQFLDALQQNLTEEQRNKVRWQVKLGAAETEQTPAATEQLPSDIQRPNRSLHFSLDERADFLLTDTRAIPWRMASIQRFQEAVHHVILRNRLNRRLALIRASQDLTPKEHFILSTPHLRQSSQVDPYNEEELTTSDWKMANLCMPESNFAEFWTTFELEVPEQWKLDGFEVEQFFQLQFDISLDIP